MHFNDDDDDDEVGWLLLPGVQNIVFILHDD